MGGDDEGWEMVGDLGVGRRGIDRINGWNNGSENGEILRRKAYQPWRFRDEKAVLINSSRSLRDRITVPASHDLAPPVTVRCPSIPHQPQRARPLLVVHPDVGRCLVFPITAPLAPPHCQPCCMVMKKIQKTLVISTSSISRVRSPPPQLNRKSSQDSSSSKKESKHSSSNSNSDRKSTRLNSSHSGESRMPSSA